MNSVILIGNLTRDPDYRETANGLCKFSIAVSDVYGDKEKTSFIPIVVFGKQAQNCDKFLSKGSKVCVQGRIQTGSYEKDGRKIYTTDVIANMVEFLSNKSNTSDADESAVRSESEAPQGYSQVSYDDLPF